MSVDPNRCRLLREAIDNMDEAELKIDEMDTVDLVFVRSRLGESALEAQRYYEQNCGE